MNLCHLNKRLVSCLHRSWPNNVYIQLIIRSTIYSSTILYKNKLNASLFTTTHHPHRQPTTFKWQHSERLIHCALMKSILLNIWFFSNLIPRTMIFFQPSVHYFSLSSTQDNELSQTAQIVHCIESSVVHLCPHEFPRYSRPNLCCSCHHVKLAKRLVSLTCPRVVMRREFPFQGSNAVLI